MLSFRNLFSIFVGVLFSVSAFALKFKETKKEGNSTITEDYDIDDGLLEDFNGKRKISKEKFEEDFKKANSNGVELDMTKYFEPLDVKVSAETFSNENSNNESEQVTKNIQCLVSDESKCMMNYIKQTTHSDKSKTIILKTRAVKNIQGEPLD